MKKTLCLLLSMLTVMSLLTISSCALTPVDAREIAFLGQDHIYLGADGDSTPPVADGTITEDEYSTSVDVEFTNNDDGYISSAKHYFSYDRECIYLAVEMNSTEYSPNSGYFMFNLGLPTLGGFSDMFTRLRMSFSLSSDGKAKVHDLNYLEFSTGVPTSPAVDPEKLYSQYGGSHKDGKTVIEVALKISALKEEIGANITNMISFCSVLVSPKGEHWYYCELTDENIEAIEKKYPAHGQPQDYWTMHILHLSDAPSKDDVGIRTMDGAKIKLDSPYTSSMIFQMELDRSYMNDLTKKYGADGFKIGMVIAPLEYVYEAGEFTAEALSKLTYEDSYKDYKVGDLEKEFCGRGTGTYIYSKHITNVTDFKREYAAIAYAEVGGERIYAKTYTRRAVAGVAFSALRDLSSAGANKEYKYNVIVNTLSRFSPYTNEQLVVLNAYAANYSTATLPQTPIGIQKKDSGDIRIVSSNVYFHIFKSLADETAKQQWAQGHADTLKETDADILLLQEMSDGIIKNKDFKWHTRLNPILIQMGYTMVDCQLDTLSQSSLDAQNPADVNYTPIFYRADKVTLVDSGHHFYESVSTNPDSYLSSSKSYTWALFEDKVSRERFITFSTHLTYHGNPTTADTLRQQDAGELYSEMKNLETKYAGVPFIVMGDLNCTRASAPYKILTQDNLVAAKSIAANSFNEHFSTNHSLGSVPGAGSAIDHALVSKSGLNVTKYQSIITSKSVSTSDHLPISVDIKFS
ncbi:MAG: hypothetical protein E7641_01645 [Ruminococcaceae bacterium]|nr:hypothetical protein [Oscillospiraceae bacterium]